MKYTLLRALGFTIAAILFLPGLVTGCLQAQTVSIVQTTADRTQLLQAQPPIQFNGVTGGTFTITITGVRRQPFDGVGAALTDSGAWLVAKKLTSSQRTNLLQALFSRSGAGLNVLTTGMSGSGYDINGPASFTYDDLASGTDFPQRRFSVSHDDAYIVPVIHRILAVNPDVKIFALPYSPPAWMKKNTGVCKYPLDCGSFNGRMAYERSLATYFVKYVQAYQARHIPIYALAIQNEPDSVQYTYPSELLGAPDEAKIIGYLGPALRAAGLGSVKILGWDHNWSLPKEPHVQGASRPGGNKSRDDGIAYPAILLTSSAASPYLAGTAYHCYGGDPSVQSTLKHAFPDADIWNTECAGGTWKAWPSPTKDIRNVERTGEGPKNPWAEPFDRSMGREILPEIWNWSRSHVWWTLVQDQNFGPQYGNCTSAQCTPLVTIDTSKSPARIVYRPGYYMLAHIGRFVQPGAYVIASMDTGIPEAAFENPDGSYVLVVYNGSGTATRIGVAWNHTGFSYSMRAKSIATFSWRSPRLFLHKH